MKPRIYKSETVRRIIEEMDKDPWYVKLKRRIKIELWVLYCLYIRRNKNRK